MKKLIGLAVAAFVFAVPAAMAGESAGCGLGSQIFEGKDGLMFNTLAATTNGIAGNQTFGMTSGTSGCNADDVVLRDKEQVVFVAANMDNLSQDMVQGSGQYLKSMAALMGCSDAVYGDFAELTQERYETLVPSLDTTATELVSGLKREMLATPALATACTRLS